MYYGERVILRGYELEDLDTLMKYWNDLEIRKFLLSQLPNSVQEEENWIRSGWDKRKKGNAYNFLMETEENEFLGSCGIGSISPIHQSANLGISILNKSYWNRGYGTDAMRTLLCIGFHLINLHRIQLEVHTFNKRAYHVYEKVGFTETGKKRKAYFLNGKYEDSILMDILRDEFYEIYYDIDLTKHSSWNLIKES